VSEPIACRWISVNERLPEDIVCVLGFWRDEDDTSDLNNGGCSVVFRKDGKWFLGDCCESETGHCGYGYTHWMPIPKSPWVK